MYPIHTSSGKRIKGFLLLLFCLSFIHITCYTKCQPGSKCIKIVELIGTNDFVMTKDFVSQTICKDVEETDYCIYIFFSRVNMN